MMRNGSSKVAPAPRTCDDIVEIRPQRKLRIRHLNPKPRDEKFAKEMEVYLRARQHGHIDSVFMPQRHQHGSKATKTINESSRNTVSLNYRNNNPSDIDDHQTPEIAQSLGNGNKNDSSHNSNAIANGEKARTTDAMEATGWVSKSMARQQANLVSPSRVSAAPSEGIMSSSGVLVSMSRPNSEIAPGEIETEQLSKKPIKLINLNHEGGHVGIESPIPESVQTPRTPHKTKGYRPISARSIKGAKSLASSEVDNDLIADLSDFDSPVKHKSSSFKDVTLFFIHGVGGSADVWNAQLDFFSTLGTEIVALDLLGHGLSSCSKKAKDYHFNEILADVETVFDKYCKKQNIIIAHSYGCAFAAVLGRRRARRVSKLVLISGGAPTPLAPQTGVFSLPLCCLSCCKPCLFSSFERDAFHAKNNDLPRDVVFDVPTYVLKYMMQGQYWPDGDDLYHRWLSMPALLLHGKHDKFISVEEEEEMSKAIYYSHLEVIDHTGHMVMMEAPKHVNQLLYDFVFQELGVLKESKNVEREPPITSRIGEVTSVHAR